MINLATQSAQSNVYCVIGGLQVPETLVVLLQCERSAMGLKTERKWGRGGEKERGELLQSNI